MLLSPERDKIECMVRLDFSTTNNEAKYEALVALVAGLDLAKAAGAQAWFFITTLRSSPTK